MTSQYKNLKIRERIQLDQTSEWQVVGAQGIILSRHDLYDGAWRWAFHVSDGEVPAFDASETES